MMGTTQDYLGRAREWETYSHSSQTFFECVKEEEQEKEQ